MHSESLTQAILGTALLFNTVFEIPDDMSLMGQIFGVGIVTYMLFWSIEKVREWELLLKKPAELELRRATKKYYDLFIIKQIRRKCNAE